MNSKFAALALTALVSLSTHAGVKVTNLGLTTDGSNGSINVTLDSRSKELPDIRVHGNTVEITLSDAKAFPAISKNVRGTLLSANALNGKAIIKAVLPYQVASDSINVGWRNNNFEVVFPRGKAEVVPTQTAATTAPASDAKASVKAATKVGTKAVATPVKTNVVDVKAPSKVSKDILNEDYLNKLMKEDVTIKKNDAPKVTAKVETKKDEIKVKQAAIAREEAAAAGNTNAKGESNFSFAGYATKFTVFLALVLGLFYGAVQLLKKGVFSRGKLGFLNNSQMIEVLSTTYVAPKRSLMIVRAHKQIFLVASSESGIEFLSEMTDTAGLIKEGEKIISGSNFDTNLGAAESSNEGPTFKLKEDINESTPLPDSKGIASLSAKDIVKFSDELKKKAKKLKPIEFN